MTEKSSAKPTYNMVQNTGYMIQLAWRNQKSVLGICLILALLHVAVSLTELYLAPLVLGKVESAAPLGELFCTIGVMAGTLALLRGVQAYVGENTMYGRVKVRMNLILQVTMKSVTTSYPNVGKPDLEKEKERCAMALNTNNSAGEAIWRVLTAILQNLLGFVIYLVLFLSLDPVLLLIATATAVLSYLCSRPGPKWSFAHRKEEGALGQRMSYIRQKAADRGALKDILIFGMGEWLEDVYTSVLTLYRDFLSREQRVYLWGDLAEVAFTLLRNGAAYGYLLMLTLRQGLPAAEFLLYFTAMGNFTTWVTGILKGFGELHQFSLDLCNVRNYLEIPEPFLFEEGKPLAPEAGKAYQITLRDVSFRYPGAEKNTLSHINLTVAPGEKLAIVGLNGAGKTTLMKLVCGLLDPTEGKVLLNGEDIRQFNRRDYYTLFSTVFQDFSVFDTTFADNITQQPESTDTAGIEDAIKRAGMWERYHSLPQGENTHIGKGIYEDGIQLSGGELQRLMLARALYKDGPIIILDEPTAALDPIAEHQLYLRYSELTQGRTSFFISHRLASTRFCDRILLLGDGRILEEGTHQSLLNLGGSYARLFEIQSQYYKEGTAHE
ncbi:MAG: ABC transporter ATP-binding protein [Acutalibacter sp.]|jgi:ATP-binding cassette subfamily B protein